MPIVFRAACVAVGAGDGVMSAGADAGSDLLQPERHKTKIAINAVIFFVDFLIIISIPPPCVGKYCNEISLIGRENNKRAYVLYW